MAPDFPRARERFRALFIGWVDVQKYAAEPILRSVTRIRQHEGEFGRVVNEDGGVSELRFRDLTHDSTLAVQDIRQGNIEKLYEVGRELAAEIAGATVRKMLRQISEVATTVQQSGREISQDEFLEMIRLVRTDFDPVTMTPTTQFLGPPGFHERLQRLINEWEQDPDFRPKLSAIYRDLVEKWRDRESCRTLVD